ncbi:MAG TPA: GNAT family N-acetyltransferase, partial [Agriterribacter sp.]|nr:GNAT family N-acetyltransferase [Agriterribacter sp.]
MTIEQIEIAGLHLEDYQQLLEAMKASYTGWQGGYWSPGAIERLIEKFPEGQIVIKADGVVVGCALSIIVDYKRFGDNHTYKQITGNYTFNTHDPQGDILYGIEIFIHPGYRGLRLGRRLYDARKDLCENLNLRAIVFGGRLPGYHEHADQLSPKAYIAKVKSKEIYDPVLSFQLANDFHVVKVLHNYLPEDGQSKEYATLLQWFNVYYVPDPKHL